MQSRGVARMALVVVLTAAWVACVAAAGAEAAPTGRPATEAPKFTGDALPTPPQQKEPWTPPKTAVPDGLITATRVLFDQGLADPRGLEYCEIELVTGSVWGGEGGVIKTHGWVFPPAAPAATTTPTTAPAAAPRFAVAWNGLVYPTVSIGEPADLRADVVALCEADEQMRAKYAKERGNGSFYRHRNAASEASSLDHRAMLPLRACLLLRLGEGELAARVWSGWTAGMRRNTNDDATHLDDPYLMLAGDWVWAMFDRAVCAHMRGDDRLALLDARAMGPVQAAVEVEASRRGFPRGSSFNEGEEKQPYLPFLDVVPQLSADQERRSAQRAAGPPRPRALPRLATMKDKAERIAVLIEDLDQVAARQMGQPGGVSLGMDPIVQALIAQGDEAVEPLLKCLEEDTRLTRSVHFWRDFSRHRSILGVHEAAYVALSGILEESFFGTASTGDDLSARGAEGRRAVAKNVRAHWEKFKGVPLVERWYLTLADDGAGLVRWSQAAANIVRPGDVEVTPSSMFGAGWVTEPSRRPGEAPKLRGEPLREKKDPTVAALFLKRMASLQEATGGFGDLQAADTMAAALAAWDGKPHAKAALRDHTKYLQDQLSRGGFGQKSWVVGRIVRMYQRRAALGDGQALTEYAEWMKIVTPEAVDGSFNDLFEPMWRNPDHPAIQEAAESQFNTPASPWDPLIQNRPGRAGYNAEELIRSPLLGLPGFRKQMVRMLADRAPAGTVTLREGGGQNIKHTAGWQSGTSYSSSDPLAPPAGSTVEFRVCDVYARQLGWVEGTPRCELYWQVERRDAAIARCIEVLNRYGDRFRHVPAHYGGDWRRGMSNGALLTLPPLDRPATEQDVADGRAVFSLAKEPGSGEARLWPLPRRPLPAAWITLKDHPQDLQTYNPATGMSSIETRFQQDGAVWQAEELPVDGSPRRYYGFVGRFDIARVPAEEIEFPAAGDGAPWASLSRKVDCLVDPPGLSRKDGSVQVSRLAVGDPLVATLRLHNRAGLSQSVPVSYYDPHAPDGPALAPGMRMKLFHLPHTADDEQAASRAGYDPQAEWQELPAKPGGKWRPAEAGERQLAPAESFEAARIDLRDWFDVTKPGAYQVQLVFRTADRAFADGESSRVNFVIARREATETNP